MEVIIIGLAALFFLGHALNWFFIATKIPDLLILVVLGFLLGPVFGFIQPDDIGKVGGVLATTALIVILYEGGLNLSAKDLAKSSLPAAAISIMGFVLIAAAGALVAWGLGFQEWPISILLGIGIGSTSSAIVIPMVKPLSISEDTKTVLSLESAFTDVLTIVIFLVLVDSFASGVFDAEALAMGVGPKTLEALVFGIVSGTVWAIIKKRFPNIIPKAFAGEAWALLTYGVIEATGRNGAIGVLSLGFILANLNLFPGWIKRHLDKTPVPTSEMTLLSEITFLLRTFFFIYLGTLVSFGNWKTVAIAVAVSILIYITRYFTVRALFKPAKTSRLDAMVATAMGPRGLACAVLATIPAARGIEGGPWLQEVMFALIPISILLTAVFVSMSEKPFIRKKGQLLFGPYPEVEPSVSSQTESADESTLALDADEQTEKTGETQMSMDFDAGKKDEPEE